jgi:hypothetical protein
MKKVIGYLVLLLVLSSTSVDAQTIRYNGYYEEKSGESFTYMRFYADGVVLAVTFSESVSKDYLMNFLSYENRDKKNVTKGFYVDNSNSIDMAMLQQWDSEMFLKKAKIDKAGVMTLNTYYYKAGIVKSNTSTFSFVEF